MRCIPRLLQAHQAMPLPLCISNIGAADATRMTRNIEKYFQLTGKTLSFHFFGFALSLDGYHKKVILILMFKIQLSVAGKCVMKLLKGN